MLQVRRTAEEDFGAVMAIYRGAQERMIRSGNPTQWARVYPSGALVAEDIRLRRSYVICEEGRIAGVFVITDGEDPTYRVIEDGAWLNGEPYITIHRIAGDGTAHGIFACAADYCKARAGNVRVDTHRNNLIMQRQIAKQGFRRCGIIHVEDGSPRIAYQWTRGLRPSAEEGE